MELRVGGKYRLGRKIGSGSFGDIYLGKQPLVVRIKALMEYDCIVFCVLLSWHTRICISWGVIIVCSVAFNLWWRCY